MKLHKSIFVLVTVGFFVVSCQQGEDTVAELTETSEPAMVHSETPTLTPSPSFTITPTPTRTPTASTSPTATLTSPCVDTYQTAPMTDKQLEHLRNHNYNFLFASDSETVNDVYSINRVDTLCGTPYLSWWTHAAAQYTYKLVSGFIVDLNQPNKNLYYPGGGDESLGYFTNIYVKARFIDRDGKGNEYWMQLQGKQPDFWFHLFQWDGLIAEFFDQPGLIAEQIIPRQILNGRTSSAVDANTILPEGLIKVNDQFIAVIHVGSTNSIYGLAPRVFYPFTDEGKTLDQLFVNALYGMADFPVAPYGSYISAEALLVPAKP